MKKKNVFECCVLRSAAQFEVTSRTPMRSRAFASFITVTFEDFF